MEPQHETMATKHRYDKEDKDEQKDKVDKDLPIKFPEWEFRQKLKIDNIPEQYFKRNPKFLEYGTAGFREEASLLPHVMYRMGIFAVLRSQKLKAAVGVMITASHNLEKDNGIKIVDPTGEMLESSWEILATEIVNKSNESVYLKIMECVRKQNIELSNRPIVIVGRDTRKSGEDMMKGVLTGIEIFKHATVINLGIVTTPQLHYIVAYVNKGNNQDVQTLLEDYYLNHMYRFNLIIKRNSEEKNKKYTYTLHLDCANGVGAKAAIEIKKRLKECRYEDESNLYLNISIFNIGKKKELNTTNEKVQLNIEEKDGELNEKCGADYVKIEQKAPLNSPSEKNVKCASIDGDADRLVYYYVDEDDKFHLLDGDRIAALIALYIKKLLDTSGLSLTLGVVQTAYSNGASTKYIKDVLGIPVKCVPTGVKHLHKKAKTFNIGIYFEANGHGTILYQKTTKDTIIEFLKKSEDVSYEQRKAVVQLQHICLLMKDTVGDALIDMLLVETILYSMNWSLCDWEKIYEDFPSMQKKIYVRNRWIVGTKDTNGVIVIRDDLQAQICKIVSNYEEGRCFIRPSGTEEMVRIYAEGKSMSDVEKLISEVYNAILPYRKLESREVFELNKNIKTIKTLKH